MNRKLTLMICLATIIAIILGVLILTFDKPCDCECDCMVESIIEDTDNIIEETVEETSNDTYPVPENRGFKSYMDYRCITSKSSKQYKLQNLYAKTGDYGIRTVNDRFCIAVGSYFTSDIGQYLDLVLENGTVIQCVLADLKSDAHTDKNNIITMHNGCVSEFVVHTESLDSLAKKMGDISYCNENWKSPVKEVILYNENVFNEN